MVSMWLPLSDTGSPGTAEETVALVLAAVEILASDGADQAASRRESAASRGRAGSRGWVDRGWLVRSGATVLSVRIVPPETAASSR
jgi:hypothetical protein